MAVGSSSDISDAKLRADPSCGVAESSINVSERVASIRASRARRETPSSPARAATFWHSSMTMMSHQAFSR